jgi:ferredoxin
MTSTHLLFEVDAVRCIACGACSSLAPSVFELDGAACRVRREAERVELSSCTAALYLCPTHAIRRSPSRSTRGHAALPPSRGLYSELAECAERARWKLADVPWDALVPEAASPELRALAIKMVFHEHATYSATRQFLGAFGDDIELSKWISVWFYEETRHPHVLAEWLRRLGERIEPDFVRRGRVSTPFTRSAMRVLVTNVISEIIAAHAYAHLAAVSPEPVLGAIAARISGDEARHAAAFFRFAQARIEQSPDRERERLDALGILHFWLEAGEQVTHPVSLLTKRLTSGADGAAPIRSFDMDGVRRRICRIVAALVDAKLEGPSDVLPLVRELVGTR